MTTWDFDGARCEICGGVGTDDNRIVECEGAVVCTRCAEESASKLAEYADDCKEDLLR